MCFQRLLEAVCPVIGASCTVAGNTVMIEP
jgi:hypothetical protein